MIGDNLSDIQTGVNAGVKKTFRIGILREDIMELQHKKNIYPDYTLPDLVAIADKISEIEKIYKSD
jgi:phosphoglycolate phosphatase-like HAD superfamily hydrolase